MDNSTSLVLAQLNFKNLLQQKCFSTIFHPQNMSVVLGHDDCRSGLLPKINTRELFHNSNENVHEN